MKRSHPLPLIESNMAPAMAPNSSEVHPIPAVEALGDRMKGYERSETSLRFDPALPLYARIDGRGFSRFTRGLERPFDARFREAMVEVTRFLVEETGASLGYTQSDEISLCWAGRNPEDPPERQPVFFEGKKQKLVSQLAALATARLAYVLARSTDDAFRALGERCPTFDARVFSLPSAEECANAVLWREQDAQRNAVSMIARCHFSHRQIENRSTQELRSLLAEKGVDVDAFPQEWVRGVFVRRERLVRPIAEAERLRMPEATRPEPGALVVRHRIEALPMPSFVQVTNRAQVVLENAVPLVKERVRSRAKP